ncbi:MAG: VOC family protein, partial [Cytophagales bacterium]|nr:VOC family protein [Cytophagales bacterium]
DVPKGHMTSLSLNYGDPAVAEAVFNALSEGGNITMPYQETFWGAMFGSFTDKFGIDWMVNCNIDKE